MKSKIYYLAFAITFCMCIIAFMKSMLIVGMSSFMLSCYLLLAAFFNENDENNGNSNTAL